MGACSTDHYFLRVMSIINDTQDLLGDQKRMLDQNLVGNCFFPRPWYMFACSACAIHIIQTMACIEGVSRNGKKLCSSGHINLSLSVLILVNALKAITLH